jgi:hypothetical protein
MDGHQMGTAILLIVGLICPEPSIGLALFTLVDLKSDHRKYGNIRSLLIAVVSYPLHLAKGESDRNEECR